MNKKENKYYEDKYISLDEIHAAAMLLRYQKVFKNTKRNLRKDLENPKKSRILHK